MIGRLFRNAYDGRRPCRLETRNTQLCVLELYGRHWSPLVLTSFRFSSRILCNPETAFRWSESNGWYKLRRNGTHTHTHYYTQEERRKSNELEMEGGNLSGVIVM